MAEHLDRSRRGWWRRVTLRDAIVFSLPPLVLGLWVFGSAVADYHRIRQFDDWWSSATSVRKFGWSRLRTALRTPRITQLSKQLSAEREDTPLLRLLVERQDWDRIDDDVGGHWGEWIDAQVLDGGDFFDGELRFRGDSSIHWTTDKKSFTLRTRSNDPYKGYRTLAFSVKDVLPQWLAATLAEEFELRSPEQELVPVYLNDRFYGIHRFIEPVDEAFLRRRGLAPGNLFRADTAERGDYFKGVPREVFRNPHVWELAAEDPRPGAPGREVLEAFLGDLNGSTAADHRRFMAWLDRGELARLLAYLLVVGDPFHMSGVHNQFWYLDPDRGTFHAIPWDVRLLDLEAPPRGSNYNRFWRSALRDPRLFAEALGEISARALGGGLLERAKRRVTAAWQTHRPAFELDALRGETVPPVGEPAAALAALERNLATLRTWVDDARVEAGVEPLPDGGFVIDVLVGGRAPAAVGLAGDAGGEPPRVRADLDLSGTPDGADHDLGATFELGTLLPGIGARGAELVPEPIHYRFFASGGAGRPLSALRVRAANALTGAEIAVEPLPEGPLHSPASSLHPWGQEPPAGEALSLEGLVRLDEDLVVAEPSSLSIAPGTTIELGPGVSLLARGRVEALGTADEPISIRRADEGRPWGVVALQGAGAGGSRFTHVRFQGGGGARLGAVRYSGMVCVHGAEGVAFEGCEFASNQGCDDALHVAGSRATVRACAFHGVDADAIDFDRSSGEIAGNEIRGAPSEGIELTDSSPRVVENELAATGARALSIAGRSAPLLLGNRIEGGASGVEVRDAAEPVLLANRIAGCERGIHALLENRSYGSAGWPKVCATQFEENGTDWVADDGARRTLLGPLLGLPGESLPGGADLEWLLRSHGVRAGELRRGSPVGLELGAPLEPLHAEAFSEDFASVTGGWSADAGASRLLQRGDVLELSLRGARASIARPHDWDLGDASRVYVLVLELAGENVAEVRAAVASPAGNVEAVLELDEDPDTFTYCAIELPPGVYEGLLLSAEPISARSLLRLHGYRIFAWPVAGPGS
jgi:hypothetical protein